MSLLTLTLTLFLIINPLGNTNTLISILKGLAPMRRSIVIMREMLFALITMLVFSFFGEWLSSVFHFQQTTIFLSSGVILFLTAIKIIFPKVDNYIPRVKEDTEPFLVPLAIPMIASPGLLAMIMLFSQAEPLVMPMVIAILLAWLLASILLLLSPQIQRLIGHSGLLACERLMGMILVLISVQRFMEGILLFINGQ